MSSYHQPEILSELFTLIFCIKLPFFYTTQSSTALPFSSPHFILITIFQLLLPFPPMSRLGHFYLEIAWNRREVTDNPSSQGSLYYKSISENTDICSECKPLPKWAFPQFHRTQFLNLFIIVTFFFNGVAISVKYLGFKISEFKNLKVFSESVKYHHALQ